MRRFGSRGLHVEVDSEPSVLDQSDLSKRLDRGDYEKQLSGLQQRLRDLGIRVLWEACCQCSGL